MEQPSVSRRNFLRSSAVTAGAVLLAGNKVLGATAGSDTLRVGLIGCGGRGVDAARNCVASAPGIEVVALADLFQHQVDGARQSLASLGQAFKVDEAHCFAGFDAYKKLLEPGVGVDLVISGCPPAFRPFHFKAAIEAGKHVFMEKPVAVDPAGCRMVIEAAKLAEQKKLAVVAGTQRRHQAGYVETMKRILDGAIGDLVAGQCYWNGGGIWFRQKTGWLEKLSDLEWQCWNWYHWDWLSGDQICEQHIHNIDVMNWAFNGPPKKILAMGGRQNRDVDLLPALKDSPDFKRLGETDGHPNILGNIYDHIATELEYPNGARVLSMGRHAGHSSDRVSERIVGTKGTSDCRGSIFGSNPFKFSGKETNPYVQEHADLILSIRDGKPLNEGVRVAESTLTAVGARMSAYTGREISFDWLLKSSKLDIVPADPKPGPGIFPPVAIPGRTKLV